jgi:hypothetical protein
MATLLLSSPPEFTQLEHFHQWLDAAGVQRRAMIAMEDSAGGGRGLVATEHIQPGELAIRVPLKATVRLEAGQFDSDDNWAGVLAIKLLDEQAKGDESFFETYLNVGLPKEAPTTPCRWSFTQRLELQNTTLIAELDGNEAWENKQQVLNNAEDSDHFLKMLGLVCSRTLKGRDGSRQLVPLIDIANHAPQEAGGGHFKVDRDAVYLYAGSRGVLPGEAITMDYGRRAVGDFLLHYGFIPTRCLTDSVVVPIQGEHISVAWKDCQGYAGHSDEVVRTACKNLLNSFPTTLEEDVSQLNEISGDVSEEYEAALQYRYAKKSLLASAMGTFAGRNMFAFR